MFPSSNALRLNGSVAARCFETMDGPRFETQWRLSFSCKHCYRLTCLSQGQCTGTRGGGKMYETALKLMQDCIFCKSTRILKIGRGHGSDFVHIVFLSTLGHTKTRSEVIGPSLTWFRNNGRLNFLPPSGAILRHFFVCLYYDNFMIFIHPN